MKKIWVIARRDVYSTIKDRNLLIIMFITPIILSTIIAAAFSGVTGGGSPIENIPVAIVNQDRGTEAGGGRVNNGDMLMNILMSNPTSMATAFSDGENMVDVCAPLVVARETTAQSGSISTLIKASRLTDPALARAGVDDGTYAAAVIIPANFSESITYTGPNASFKPVQIEIYGDSNRSISAGIVRSIVEAVTNNLLTGNITFATFFDTLISNNWTGSLMLSASGVFNAPLACAFNTNISNLSINFQSPTGTAPPAFNPLVSLGASIAGFFALFTASASAAGILEERRNGTLLRMLVSPTPRITIILGKLLGTFIMVLVQLAFLFVALTLVNTVFEGEFRLIWGDNMLAIIALLLATSLAVSGVGIIVVSLAKNIDQANIFSSIIAMFMGVLGGAFFSVDQLPETLQPITRLSVIRWSTEAFTRLSQGNSDIMLNLVWLLGLGGVMFLFGLILFNRRQDV